MEKTQRQPMLLEGKMDFIIIIIIIIKYIYRRAGYDKHQNVP